MRLKFYDIKEDLKKGIDILSKDLGFEIGEGGIRVKTEKAPGNIEVSLKNGEGFIKYDKKIHFYRALGLFIEQLQKNEDFNIVEEPQFTLNGPMLDMSRNAVMTVESVKKTIKIMAVMGLNMLMLYTEDTYKIEGRPYFGYMRGKYSFDELKECDDYADIFGIEIIPCIQTLGHLAMALRWDCTSEIRDTEGILLAGNDKTYEFVEDMIKAASAPFRSKRIHIGMDEAHEVGLGRYLNINGYRRRFDILNEHLKKVVEITSKYGLRPMMWSDMYFKLGSKTGDYYDLDAEFPEDIVKNIPKDVQFVYWDYYHNDEKEYSSFIKKHKSMCSSPVFAGGIWTWAGLVTNYPKTFITTNAALSACKKEGVKEVIATMWGDDGAEINYFSGLLGMQLFAEHGYSKELDTDKLKNRFKFCTGCDYNSFMDLGCFDKTPETKQESITYTANPSKLLMWQDILLGMFDKYVEGTKLAEYYGDLEKKMEEHLQNSGEWSFIFEFPKNLASVLSIKSDIGVRIKESYDNNDLEKLKEIVNIQLPELKEKINKLRDSHRRQWFKTCKPFGWEVMDIRYGGATARIETAIIRIKDYLDEKIDKIEELDEKRLYFDGTEDGKNKKFVRYNKYHRIAVPGRISHETV